MRESAELGLSRGEGGGKELKREGEKEKKKEKVMAGELCCVLRVTNRTK